ncbi:hypothetical protein MUB04_14705 [Acinetobacter indicus]|uniref:hypothetical protein n=1 Tax=Acinetobacter TaxID=469 RepID=UPI0015D238B6|nr:MULTISPECIES: hypothetical protein [Acinetobacter]MCP0917783.1 hypothetical protein [Acinetobacter indicus]
MSATQQNYEPTFEIAVLKSIGEAGEEGKRDVVIKIESGKEDLNESVHSLTIPQISEVNLSLKINGFDIYEDNADLGIKTLSGNIIIVAKINGEVVEEFKVHSPVVPISPINAKDNIFPPIIESKQFIERAWYSSFAEALTDIIDQTTVITGNQAAFNPYTLESSESNTMANPKRQSEKAQSTSPLRYWGGVALITVAAFVIVLLGFKFINNKSNEQQTVPQASTQGGVQQVPYDESQDIANQGSFPPVPQLNDGTNQPNSEQQIEAEVLDEFGLESTVNLE